MILFRPSLLHANLFIRTPTTRASTVCEFTRSLATTHEYAHACMHACTHTRSLESTNASRHTRMDVPKLLSNLCMADTRTRTHSHARKTARVHVSAHAFTHARTHARTGTQKRRQAGTHASTNSPAQTHPHSSTCYCPPSRAPNHERSTRSSLATTPMYANDHHPTSRYFDP